MLGGSYGVVYTIRIEMSSFLAVTRVNKPSEAVDCHVCSC